MTAMPALWEFRSDDASEALNQRGAFAEALFQRFGTAVDRTAAEIVFTELVANVMRHAPGPIVIRLTEGDGATLEVVDSGPGFDFKPVLPPASAECGRGLYIISRLTRRVQTERRDGQPARVLVALIAYQTSDAPAWIEGLPNLLTSLNGSASRNGASRNGASRNGASHNGGPEARNGTSPEAPRGTPNEDL